MPVNTNIPPSRGAGTRLGHAELVEVAQPNEGAGVALLARLAVQVERLRDVHLHAHSCGGPRRQHSETQGSAERGGYRSVPCR